MTKFLLLIFGLMQCYVLSYGQTKINITGKAPKIYCVQYRSESCVALLFGSVHYAHHDQPAITDDLLRAVYQAKNIYFELAPYAQRQINAKDLVSEKKYLEDRRNFFQDQIIPREQLLLKMADAKNNFLRTASINEIAQIIDQLVQSECRLTRLSGTEEYITRKIAGLEKTIFSLEDVNQRALSPGSGELTEIQKKQHLQSAEDSQTEKDSLFNKQDAYEFCKPIVETLEHWKQQTVCETISCDEQLSESLKDSTKKRNSQMTESILHSIAKKQNPVVVVGFTHLYGPTGILESLKQYGYKIVDFSQIKIK